MVPSPSFLCLPQLKKRALDQLRLVKPKHAGSPTADPPEQLLLEPSSGACPGAKVQPGLPLESSSVHLWPGRASSEVSRGMRPAPGGGSER